MDVRAAEGSQARPRLSVMGTLFEGGRTLLGNGCGRQ